MRDFQGSHQYVGEIRHRLLELHPAWLLLQVSEGFENHLNVTSIMPFRAISGAAPRVSVSSDAPEM